MRVITFSLPGRSPSLGVVTADGTGVVDVGARLDGNPDLSAVLADGRLDEVRAVFEAAAVGGADHAVEEITFERTVPRPSKIFCIGVNYGGRDAEYADAEGAAERSYPSVFVRFPGSLTGHGQPLVRPPESDQLDYEGEIVAVVGRGGRRIPAAQAAGHLAGLTIGNEGTIRDWVRHARFNVTQGKNWDRSGAMGPWLVTMDEVGDLGDLHLRTHVNGELRQEDSTATMAYPIVELVEYLSTFCTLGPGDVIFTGTPTGAGARFDPPRFLAPGDVVEVTVDGLGTLRNPVADE